MPSFFMKGAQKGKKRKPVTKPSSKPKGNKDEKIDSDDEEESIHSANEENDESESDHETAQAKRLRIAKEYIQELEEKEKDKEDDKDIDHDAIAHRLRQDALEEAGQLQTFIASQVSPVESEMKYLRGHKLSVTCVVVSADNKYIFSSSKDGTIIKWDLCTCQKSGKVDGISKKTLEEKSNTKGHVGNVTALALSTDFKFLASAGQDTFINIWDPTKLSWLHTFRGHRDQVTGLAFQHKQHHLYSGSHDKAIKVWNLNEMAYVETLFGHEDAVLGIDSLLRDRVVSCGGRDRSVRLWKVPEESQLVFQSSNIASSFDCVTMLNEEYFLAGGDDGSLSIFFTRKKKPVTLRTKAHVKNEHSPQSGCDESWVSAVTSLPYTDLVASGSCDGCIKLWRCEKSFRALMPIHTIKVNGFINGLKFTSDGGHLIAAVGQEHRLGRWWKMKNVKNAIVVIPINIKKDEENENT